MWWLLLPLVVTILCLLYCQHNKVWKNLKIYKFFLIGFFYAPFKISELLLLQMSPIAKAWLGPFQWYVITKPEYVKIILSSAHALSKPEKFYKFLEPVTGNGIFKTEVPNWRRNRKMVLPAFKPTILKSFVKVFTKRSKTMCEMFDQRVNEEFNIHPVVAKCTLATILETAMGVEVTAQELEEIEQCLKRLAEICFTRMQTFWHHPDWIYQLTKLYQEEKLLTEKYHNFVHNVIKSKRNIEPNRFLDLLLSENLSDDEIRQEVQTIIFGGYDTTANTISFTLLMLAMHPEIQEKVNQEVISVVGVKKEIEPEDLESLIYLERVIKETLRLFPVGPVIARKTQKDIQLKDHLTIQKNSLVLLSIYSMHRDRNIWEDPLNFDPDRFLCEEIEKRHSYSFIPFSGGPRNCLGAKYGMMSLKTFIAETVRKFSLYTTCKKIEEIKLVVKITLGVSNGWNITFKRRKYL